MKKFSLFAVSAIAAVALSSSCSHEVAVNKTAEIDSLQAVLATHEKTFNEISVTEVETIMQTIDTDIDSAAAICEKKKLSISQEEGTFFGRYQALKSGLKKFGTRYNDIKEELAHTKSQLKALKADVTADKLDEEARKKYVIDEASAIKNVASAIEQLHGTSVTVIEQFKARRPEYLEMLSKMGK